uniref:Latrophilin-3-like n=1 Tax=Phallusia mammillata TaxID=59560 RepID=A0A6F9DKC0_9ASCI|nr:latrophilin-3-like [Phallusia mammillata]
MTNDMQLRICNPHYLLLIFLFGFAGMSGSDDSSILKKIERDFVRVRGMKMDEYNFFWTQISMEECVQNCLEEKTIYCRSFCYSVEARACSVYEKARGTAPPAFYNQPGTVPDDPYGGVGWDYFERKSAKYRQMEEEVNRLKNLTEINVAEASTALGNVAELVQPAEEPGSGSEITAGIAAILPSELEIAGESILTVMKLNPIANTSLEGVKEFTDVIANVSSLIIDPSYADAWLMVQKNPVVPGSAGVVTTAETLCREASHYLLDANQTSNNYIKSEAESVAFWMEVIKTGRGENSPLVRSTGDGETFSSSSEESFSSTSSSTYTFPGPDEQEEEDEGEEIRPTTSATKRPHQTFVTNTHTTFPPRREDFLGDTISLPRRALGDKSVVMNVRYKNLGRSMPTRKNDDRLQRGETVRRNVINSAVLTTTVIPPPPEVVFQRDPVIIVFRHEREARGNVTGLDRPVNGTTSAPEPSPITHSEETLHCVYWDTDTSGGDAGSWSTRGCSVLSSNATHTVCNCSHLTSFAVLIQIVDYNMDDATVLGHQKALSIISKIGCALSFIGVLFMCAAFIKLKFHTENMKIHFNLGVAVGLADLVFLFEEIAESSTTTCVIVTVFLYYFNMSVLAWMLIEGIHLYSQVVVVFVSARRWVKYYIFAGWGAPLLIMAISMGILNVKLGSNGICWLSPADNSIWAFSAPALLVLIINTVILITVVRVILNIQPEKSNHMKLAKTRNAVKGSIFLFPLLGTTWLFGFLCLSENTLVFQYLFAITNSLQGFFLFVFHCLCNSEVREDARRHKWFGSSTSKHFTKQDQQSGAFGLNVANGLRRFRNSISFEMPTSSSFNSSDQTSSDGSDVERVKMKRLRKITNLFPKIFTSRLPSTIKEEEDKYAATVEYDASTATSSTANTPKSRGNPSLKDKNLPLPGMPVKNDRIISSTLSHITLPKEAQLKLDLMLADQIVKNLEDEKEGAPTSGDKEDSLDEYLKDEDRKMKMSYDSGLNSIDNESLLDETDEVWMASLLDKQKNEENTDVAVTTETPV